MASPYGGGEWGEVSFLFSLFAAEEALRLSKDLLLRGDLGWPGTGMQIALFNSEQL